MWLDLIGIFNRSDQFGAINLGKVSAKQITEASRVLKVLLQINIVKDKEHS